jgi:hypothetical protein
MIPVAELVYELDIRLNKLATLQHQTIPIENKIIYLNEAIIKLVKVKIDPNNTLGLGFEAFKKRYEDLQNLVESMHDHPLVPVEADKILNKWTVDLTKLDPEYMFYIDAYVLADKGTCKNRPLYINHSLTKHSDVFLLAANNQYKPSFEYQETFDTLAENNLEIYTDGTFTPTKVFIGYLRYPNTVDIEGYIHLDGTPSTTVNCDLEYYLKDEVLNFATQDAAMALGDMQTVQSTLERIKTQE